MTDPRVAEPTDEEKILFWMREAKEARFALQEAVKAEREACAKVCEEMGGTMSMFANTSDARMHNNAVRGCAAAVRARSADPPPPPVDG